MPGKQSYVTFETSVEKSSDNGMEMWLMSKSTRQTAADMDRRVSRLFSSYGIDPGIATKGSGSVQGDGDRRQRLFMREDKHREISGWSISKNDWEKALDQATRQGKMLMFVVENQDEEPIVAMPIHQFLSLLSTTLDQE